jgi:hypothetical protein
VSLVITAPVKVKSTPYKYAWLAGPDGYTLDLGTLTARIWAVAGVWNAEVRVGEKRYLAARPTLEAAFKASDRLIYRNRPECMWVTDCKEVIRTFEGELPEC